MADTKTIEQWEIQWGIVLIDTKNLKLDDKTTDAEFKAIMASHQYKGVNHADRKEFLEANGYEITRENLSDHTLSSN